MFFLPVIFLPLKWEPRETMFWGGAGGGGVVAPVLSGAKLLSVSIRAPRRHE